MRIHKLISACLLIFFAPCALAQAQSEKNAGRCSDATVKLVGKRFHLDNFVYPEWGESENGGLIVAGVCKSWPIDNMRMIAAFAYNEGVEYEKLLVVAVINTRTNQIISSYKSSIQEDASLTVGENSLRIDTARYDLAPGVRAFGIDLTNSYHQGCGDGGLDTVRTLYVPDRKTLRPVLRLYAISFWRYVQQGNGPCAPLVPENVAEIIENLGLTLEMSKSVTNGYRDIVIRASSSRDDDKPTGKGRFSYVLQYDGSQYPTDQMWKAFEKWDVISKP